MNFRFLFVLALLAISVVSNAQKATTPWAKAREREIQAAREEGIPIQPKDIDRPLPPPEQNAATYYAKLSDYMKSHRPPTQDFELLNAFSRSDQPGVDQIQRAREILAANHERTELIHRAASCAEYVVPRESADIPTDPMKHFPMNAAFRDHARWLTYESMLLLEEGKPLEAIRAAKDGFAIARHVWSDSTVMSFLVAVAIDSMTVSSLKRVLSRYGNEPAVADAIRRVLETGRREMTLAEPLRGEVVGTLAINQTIRRNLPKYVHGNPNSAFKDMAFQDTPEFRTWRGKFGYPADPEEAGRRFLDFNDAHYIAYVRRIAHLIDLPYPEATAAIRAIVREAEIASRHPDYSFAGISFSSTGSLPRVKAVQQAMARVIAASAAAVEWRSEHGQFPARLEDAISPPPIDPFVMQPLKYRREAGGFVIYSVGETGKFDGGQRGTKPSGKQAFFRYP